VADIEAHSARIVGRPGKPDTTWSVPAIPGRSYTAPAATTDNGRAFLEYSYGVQSDTVWIRKVTLDGGVASPAMPVRWEKWLGVFPDGSFETVLSDSTGGLGWYRLAPGTQRSVRLGSAPVQGLRTEWSGSDDGLRFVVVKPVDRPDIYLLRNFGELLKR
jgi:hypothetical protein